MQFSENAKAFAKAGAAVVALTYSFKFFNLLISASQATVVREFLTVLALWVLFLLCSFLIGLAGGALIGLLVDGLTGVGAAVVATALSFAFTPREHLKSVLLIIAFIGVTGLLMPVFSGAKIWLDRQYDRLRQKLPSRGWRP